MDHYHRFRAATVPVLQTIYIINLLKNAYIISSTPRSVDTTESVAILEGSQYNTVAESANRQSFKLHHEVGTGNSTLIPASNITWFMRWLKILHTWCAKSRPDKQLTQEQESTNLVGTNLVP